MSFLRKIKKLLSFEKKQTMSDAKKNELNEKQNVLNTYMNRESIRKRYLEYFEEDVRWQKLYPLEYMQLQKEYSEETWMTLKPTVDKHIKREKRKAKLLERFDEDAILKNQYGQVYEELSNAVSDEEVDRYENILQEYEYRRSNCNWWRAYLESFPKLREKYAREYELLQNDLSNEEYRAVVAIISCEKKLLVCLIDQYTDYVKETTQSNYNTGKVEKLYEGFIRPEELMTKYPEETEALIEHYKQEFKEVFFEKDGSPKYTDRIVFDGKKTDLRFRDMSYYREYIERNQVFTQYVITDREYTVISNKLRTYVPNGAIRGIAGTYTGYSMSYENFLAVKERYPEEVVFYASQDGNKEDIREFINKVYPYLTQHEIQYHADRF